MGSVTVTVPASASIGTIDTPGYVLSSKERVAGVTIDGDITIRLGRLGITTDETIIALAGQLQTAFEELRRAAIDRIRLAKEGRPTDPCRSPVCPVDGEHQRWSQGCVQRLALDREIPGVKSNTGPLRERVGI